MTINDVREWMAVCESAGLELPDQIRVLDAYSRLLEAEILHLQKELKKDETTAGRP